MGDAESIRARLARRLTDELGDPDVAQTAVDALDEPTLERFAADDIATTPRLAYRPSRVAADDVDTLWVLAFGYRHRDHLAELGDGIPPMHDLEAGPVNEALARAAIEFVQRRAVPIVAQWEVGDLLLAAGVPGVISVEPDTHADGTVTYLSTAGVLRKGRRLAQGRGVAIGRVGLLGHADHVSRCLLTAESEGLDAAVPDGVELPKDFDVRSGQPWTRSRSAFVSVDLLARAHL